MFKNSQCSVKWSVAVAALVGSGLIASAQNPAGAAQTSQQLAQQDRQRIMDELQITSIPPGAPGSSNPETYNEATANPYPKLPDPLTLKNGKKVTSKDMWVTQRRPEILEDFEREVYGRRKYGELVENVLAANEYHWMAGNYFKYGGHWDNLPVDSHELVALIAPRPVFISAGRGPDLNPDGTIATRTGDNGAVTAVNINDAWVDAKGSFLAAAGAGPVYTLLGKKDVGAAEFPTIDTALITGDIGFRQHTGGHTDGPTWPTFLTFADKFIKLKN